MDLTTGGRGTGLALLDRDVAALEVPDQMVTPLPDPDARSVASAPPAPWAAPSWDELVREHADRVYRLAYRLSGNRTTPRTSPRRPSSACSGRCRTTRRARSRAGCTGSPPTCSSTWYAAPRIRMEALPEDSDRVPRDEPDPEQLLRRRTSTPTTAGRARRAAAGVPRRRRAVRHRGPVLRGDRRPARREARHGPLRIHRGRAQLRDSLAHRTPATAQRLPSRGPV